MGSGRGMGSGEQDGEGPSARDLLISGAAMLALGVVLALVAQWLIRGGLSEGWAAAFDFEYRAGERQRTQKSRVPYALLASGGVCALLGVGLGVLGVYSIGLAAKRGMKGG